MIEGEILAKNKSVKGAELSRLLGLMACIMSISISRDQMFDIFHQLE